MAAGDDVATVIDRVAAGEDVAVSTKQGAVVSELTSLDDVDLYHKLALHDIAKGSLVRKYGEVIGRATDDIAQGAHVHTHNIASVKTRNDD